MRAVRWGADGEGDRGAFRNRPGVGAPSRFGDGAGGGHQGPRTCLPVTGAAVRWGAGTASVVVTAEGICRTQTPIRSNALSYLVVDLNRRAPGPVSLIDLGYRVMRERGGLFWRRGRVAGKRRSFPVASRIGAFRFSVLCGHRVGVGVLVGGICGLLPGRYPRVRQCR